jgi:hypothetical protein
VKILLRIFAMILFIAVIGLTAQSQVWAKNIKLHDLNGSVVDTNQIKSIEQPRRSSDGRFWILTAYLHSQAGPMAIKFQYPPEKENLARQDFEAIKRGK